MTIEQERDWYRDVAVQLRDAMAIVGTGVAFLTDHEMLTEEGANVVRQINSLLEKPEGIIENLSKVESRPVDQAIFE